MILQESLPPIAIGTGSIAIPGRIIISAI